MLKKVIALLLTCVTIGSTAIPICAANMQYTKYEVVSVLYK